MKIRILGAHLAELKGARLTSLLVDDVLAVDAGGLTSALSLPEQKKIETVLLTHHHFDHTRDLVTLAANVGYYWRKQLVVHAPRYTLDIVSRCLLDGQIYANFLEYPSKEKPTLMLEAIEPYSRKTIAGYDVLAVPAKHSVPAVGYQITSSDGRSFFYTGDTTAGMSESWQHISPQLLITEVAGPDEFEDWLKKAGHLCPRFLRDELIQFRQSMRDKVHLLEGKLAELIHFGEENESISDKMHRLTLDIVRARDLPQLLDALDRHLKEGFAVPHHAMRIWNTPEQAVSDTLKNEVDAQMHPTCGALRHEEASEWFGEAASHLKSFAAVPLRGEHTVGLLVLASEDAQRFYPEMGTLYLDRLGQLVGAALTRLA